MNSDNLHIETLRSLAAQSNWIKLEEKGREVLSKDPNQGEAMALLAYSLREQGRLDEALTSSVQATTLSPSNWLSHYVAGTTLRWLGREMEACDYLRRAAIISPEDSQTLQQLNEAIAASEAQSLLIPLRALAEQRDWVKLEAAGREVLSKDPNQGEAMALLAYSLQQQSRLEEALIFSVKAATLTPSSWLPNFTSGVALRGLGRVKEACNYLRQAITVFPNDHQTLRQLIEAIAASDGLELAAEEYAAHCRRIGRSADIVVAPVRTVADWVKSIDLPLLDAGDVEEIPFEVPCVWGETLASERITSASIKPYVADINNVRIFSCSSIILTADGTALSDTGGHSQFGHHISFAYEKVVIAQVPGKVLLNFSEFNTREIEAGIFMSGLASNAFGHWLPEFLPKLQFLKQHPDFATLPIIVDANMPESHFWHLRRLVDNPLAMLQTNESFLCRRLLVAPSPTFWPVELFPNDIPLHELGGVSPRALRFLRGNLKYDNSRPRNRRIFLSRRNLKWMRLLNDEEISLDLSKIGFETIFIEEMTASEQVDMFQHAQWIVAPGGSALMNLTFADPSVKLLVFLNRNVFNWGSYSATLGALGYQPIGLRSEPSERSKNKHADYTVSIQRIRQALADMGMDEAVA